MTSSLPAGGGLTPDAPADTELDENAAPETSGEPDTAGDAAGESTGDPTEPAGADGTQLDGPALENPEMHRATDDLRSSEAKTAQARKFADDLAAGSQPDRPDN